ncbi:MAG: glycosyltransferase family 4 protein [Thermoguttaceae bacterium]|nr:glycosyltransferase family 4 protein [Thermoguttaceae bacterium]
MKPMRVMFCCQSYTAVGGVESWLTQLCRRLPAIGWEPIIALAKGVNEHRPERFRQWYPGLPTIEIDGSHLDYDGRVRAVMRSIRQHRPSLMVPLSLVEAYDAACHAKAAGLDIRVLARIAGNFPEQMADLRRYRDFIDMVAGVAALNVAMAIRWAGIQPSRVRRAYCGVDPPLPDVTAKANDGRLRLGLVSRLEQHDKRVLDLIPLCRRLREQSVEYVLDIVGDGSCFDELRSALAGDIARGRVRMHGWLSKEDIYRRIYPHLDVILLLSAYEGFPNVLPEAMVHGAVPVIAEYLGCRAEGFIEPETTGLTFAIADTEGAAACIKRLAEASSLRERLSAQAHQRAASECSWDRSMQHWRAFFEDAMSLPPMRSGSLPPLQKTSAGRLDRWPIPPWARDTVRQFRGRWFGAAVTHAEEWAFCGRDHSPEMLAEIEQLARELDQKPTETSHAAGIARRCEMRGAGRPTASGV